MIDSNNLSELKELDKSNILGSIQSLSEQVKQASSEVGSLDIPEDSASGIENIVVAAMGGSGLGPHIFKSLFFEDLKIPFEIVNDYNLPNYVGEKTLVILSSYSGGTEETIAAAEQALELKARIIGFCTGGKLAEFLRKHYLPAYIFDPKHNPSNQPRMGIGYSVGGFLTLMQKLGIVNTDFSITERIVEAIQKAESEFDIGKESKAREVARSLKGKSALVISSGFLAGNAHAFANQLNENAKTLSDHQLIPELNHHLLEGLTNPPSLKENILVLLLESNLYSKKNQIRVGITKKILEKQQIPYRTLVLDSGDKFEQSFRVLVFGSYVSFYLAMLYGIDPTPIPWVDLFKEELRKTST